ncbi:hypothetical protein [Aliikangiella maris]|uniref:Lipoprotein n=2 Tax=Aliikangiella maris TaxID=3162458 RepID=A0ABV3MJ28_9GAMM
MMISRTARFPLLFFYVLFLISGCAIQLAPNYDKSLYDGITQSNNDILTLVAQVADGTSSSDFKQRESTYNSLIGRIDALALQSNARPVPDSKVIDKVNNYLTSRGIATVTSSEIPSATALKEISKNLTKMKQTDQTRGLGKSVVAIFKNAFIISMDQALTYEAFLER